MSYTTKFASDRERLTKALNSLTHDGFWVGDAVADCSTCTLALIPDGTKRFAYVHEQDVDERSFDRDGTMVGRFYVGWGTLKRDARAIIDALNFYGFVTEWDNSKDTRIGCFGITTTRYFGNDGKETQG